MDGRELARLLNASFRYWGVAARAEPLGDVHIGARIAGPGLSPLYVRHVQGVGAIRRWRCTAANAAIDVGHEAASIGSLLKSLRETLDPEFLPGRAIIGIRPSDR